MRVNLTINGTSFCEYIKEEGLSIKTEDRVEKSYTTLNGTLYEKIVSKLNMDVKILDLYDHDFRELAAALRAATPAIVSYSDLETGEVKSGEFYVHDLTYDLKKSIGQLTYVTGISFVLVEK